MIEPDVPVPLLLHEGEGPLFIGKPAIDRHLDCSCGRRLVENYYPACFIGLAIRCASCSSITYTQLLPDGEVLPFKMIGLPQLGRLRLKGPLDYTRVAVMASSDEIQKSQQAAPKLVPRPPSAVSKAWLSSLEAQYDMLTGGMLSRDVAKLQRFDAQAADASYAIPLVWATRTLLRHIDSDYKVESSSAIRASLLRVLSFDGIIKAWKHHARFQQIARGFASTFFHATGTLMTASLLHQEGNPIGLSTSSHANEPNPDLYARRGSEERIYIEIKSPRLFQSIGEIPLNEIQDVVDRTLEKQRTRKQVNQDRRGVIMITSTSLQPPAFEESLRSSVAGWVRRRGHDRRGLAAVMTLVPTINEPGKFISLPSDLGYRGDTVINPHFVGDQILNATPDWQRYVDVGQPRE